MSKCIYCKSKKVLRTLAAIIDEKINMPLGTLEGDAVDNAYNSIDDAWALLDIKCGHEDGNTF